MTVNAADSFSSINTLFSIHNQCSVDYHADAQIDMESEPKENANGHAYTPGVTELFRAWNEQLALLEPISRGDFLLKMAQVLLETMTEYQHRQEQYLDEMAMEDEGDMFRVCAVANNGARCFVLAGDFKEDIHKMLEEEYKVCVLPGAV